jgi:hypothetical protein
MSTLCRKKNEKSLFLVPCIYLVIRTANDNGVSLTDSRKMLFVTYDVHVIDFLVEDSRLKRFSERLSGMCCRDMNTFVLRRWLWNRHVTDYNDNDNDKRRK